MPTTAVSKWAGVPPDTAEHPWIRTSERLELAKCPQAWEWAYVDRIKPVTAAPALRFGTLIHSALEAFYLRGLKRGPKPAETFEILYAQELKTQNVMGWYDEDGSWHEAGQLGVEMLNGYYDMYGDDNRWFVLAQEIPFHMPVYHPVSKRLLFTYVGVIDLVVRDRATPGTPTAIVDHKTTKDDPTKKTEALVLDEQTGTYWSYGREWLLANGYLKAGTRLAGMYHNFLKKGKYEDDRPQNAKGLYLNQPKKDVLVATHERLLGEVPRGSKNVAALTQILGAHCGFGYVAGLGEISKKQPGPMFHRELTYRDEYDSQMVKQRIMAQYRLMRMFRDGDLAVFKTPGTLHNPHCKWCPFQAMCELHEQGSDWEEFRDATMSSWEPYSQHEILEGR